MTLKCLGEGEAGGGRGQVVHIATYYINCMYHLKHQLEIIVISAHRLGKYLELTGGVEWNLWHTSWGFTCNEVMPSGDSDIKCDMQSPSY